MKKITKFKLIESLAKIKHPLTGDALTEETAYETLLDQQVVDILKQLAFNLDESDYLLINDNNLIVSLAYGRHPESGKKLAKGTALAALKHKQVKSGLERLVDDLSPTNKALASNQRENKKSPVTVFSVASMLVLSVVATYFVVQFLDHREKQLFGVSGNASKLRHNPMIML